MATDTKALIAKVESIEAQLADLKERLVEANLLTQTDRRAIRAAKADLRAGRTTRIA